MRLVGRSVLFVCVLLTGALVAHEPKAQDLKLASGTLFVNCIGGSNNRTITTSDFLDCSSTIPNPGVGTATAFAGGLFDYLDRGGLIRPPGVTVTATATTSGSGSEAPQNVGALSGSTLVYYMGIKKVKPGADLSIPMIVLISGSASGFGNHAGGSNARVALAGGSAFLQGSAASPAIPGVQKTSFQHLRGFDMTLSSVVQITSGATCSATANQYPDFETFASCTASVDPIFSFDQLTFDQRMGANTFPLTEFFAIEYSPNISVINNSVSALIPILDLLLSP